MGQALILIEISQPADKGGGAHGLVERADDYAFAFFLLLSLAAATSMTMANFVRSAPMSVVAFSSVFHCSVVLRAALLPATDATHALNFVFVRVASAAGKESRTAVYIRSSHAWYFSYFSCGGNAALWIGRPARQARTPQLSSPPQSSFLQTRLPVRHDRERVITPVLPDIDRDSGSLFMVGCVSPCIR